MWKDIYNWLESEPPMLRAVVYDTPLIFYKIERDSRFDIIFSQSLDEEVKLQMASLNYQGVYDRVNKQVFNARDMLYTVLEGSGYDHSTSYGNVAYDFTDAVRSRINSIINNDRNNLIIKDDSQIKSYIQELRMKSMRENGMEREAREMFLAGKPPEDIVFDSNYEDYSIDLTKNAYLSYISDKGETVDRFARQWIDNNQERMYVDFLENDITKAALQDIIADIGNPLHHMRAIIQAMRSVDCKTVNVTTVIDGKELTFKTTAEELKADCGSHYSGYNILAQDRHDFTATYGDHADYRPQDIVQITYGKKVLYDRNLFEKSLDQAGPEISESEQDYSQIMGM